MFGVYETSYDKEAHTVAQSDTREEHIEPDRGKPTGIERGTD